MTRRPDASLAIAYCGAVAPEALAAHRELAEDIPGAGLLAITSPDRLHRDWRAARADGEISVAERLLARLRPGAALDWTRCSQLHTAVLQVILAARMTPAGPCGDPWVRQWLAGNAS